MTQLRLSLRNPDFTTARRIADVINAQYPGTALAENPTIVALRPPEGRDMVSFVTAVEDLEVEPEAPAKVIIDEVAGVVVMGEHVRLSTVAIAQGNLTIQIEESPQVSQPAPFSDGQTTVVPHSKVSFDEEKGKQLLRLGSRKAPRWPPWSPGWNASGRHAARDAMISILAAGRSRPPAFCKPSIEVM